MTASCAKRFSVTEVSFLNAGTVPSISFVVDTGTFQSNLLA